MFSIITIASSTTKPVEIVSAINDRLSRLNPSRYITANVPHQRQRHRQAGDDRGRQVAQEQKDHQHHQHDRQAQLELHVVHRCPDRAGAIRQYRNIDGRWQSCLHLRQQFRDVVHDLDDIGARLPLNIQDDRRRAVCPRTELRVLRPSTTVATSVSRTGEPLR